MLLLTPKKPWDFELLDTGLGYRLEKWGSARLIRPDPQIIWARHLPENEWDKADARFSEENKRWEAKTQFPDWVLTWENVKFLAKLSPFKHTGIFAEQAANWEWTLEKLKIKDQKSKLKILNLFAYTGAATMVLTKAGHFVTHVDASKPALAWAKENQRLNKFADDSVRWILDDAVKFVAREVKRGATYDGIIMDPPAFGHSPTGKVWKFNDDLPGLLLNCTKLLSPNASFLLINGYATNSSAIALNNLLEDTMKRPGKFESGELCLAQRDSRLISTGIFARWSRS